MIKMKIVEYDLILLFVCLCIVRDVQSALPGVFSGPGHQIVGQKVPNYTQKRQNCNLGNHTFGEKSLNQEILLINSNNSKAPSIFQKWN